MLSIALALLATVSQAAPSNTELLGPWDAWLESPGGKIPFGLELTTGSDGWHARISNGDETFEAARLAIDRDALTLWFDPYDSKITARFVASGSAATPNMLDGEWIKRSGPSRWTVLPFRARAGVPRTAGRQVEAFVGRWAVSFEESDGPAVAIFEPRLTPRGNSFGVRGTVLTTLGDYRYLAGSTEDGSHLELACFDGAHAFLFKAELKPGSRLLEGDFWSGDSWHELWTAVRNEAAQLPDPFGLTKSTDHKAGRFRGFPDLAGDLRTPSDFAGKARILVLFGTWCPNCNDEAAYLRELDERYRARGLSIVGLAFEHTGEFERDATQVKLFAAHHKLAIPLLIAGTSDKAAASKQFPLLDQVRAFPTTVFLHSDGRVRAVHQGYSGPAAGAAHTKLREDFERLIEELLAEGEAVK